MASSATAQRRAFKFVNPQLRKKRRPNPAWRKADHMTTGRNASAADQSRRSRSASTVASHLLESTDVANEVSLSDDYAAYYSKGQEHITPSSLPTSQPASEVLGQPILPDSSQWTSFLDACTMQFTPDQGETASPNGINPAPPLDFGHNTDQSPLEWTFAPHLALMSPGTSLFIPNPGLGEGAEDEDSLQETAEVLQSDNNGPRRGFSRPSVASGPNRDIGQQLDDDTNNYSDIEILAPTLSLSQNWTCNNFQILLNICKLGPSFSDTKLTFEDNQRLCVLPVTADFPLNPFRWEQIPLRKFHKALLHGISGLAYHHLNREAPDDKLNQELTYHRRGAASAFLQDIMNEPGATNLQDVTDLIGTILVVFTLEATKTGICEWEKYIQCAYRIVELAGGMQSSKDRPRLQAQMSMLLWWDVTIALISRQRPVFPYSDFETLMAYDLEGDWSFFNVSGCPRDLLISLFQLAHMASELEQTRSMRFTTFHMEFVDEVERSLLQWTHESKIDDLPSDADEDGQDKAEEAMHHAQDIRHCCEAWRAALLVYIYRVFRWKRTGPPPAKLKFWARCTVDSIRSCRRTSYISKQLLLAAFLAGTEVTDEVGREAVSDYCTWWHTQSGYECFANAKGLLNEVWHEQDNSIEGAWWGDVVHRKQQQLGPGCRYKFG